MAVRYGKTFLLAIVLLGYIIYPSWAVHDLELRSFFLIGLMVYSGIAYVLIHFSTRHLEDKPIPNVFSEDIISTPLAGLLLLFGVAHVYFALFPIAPIDDRLYHVYAPLRLFEYILPAIKAKAHSNPWTILQVTFLCIIFISLWLFARYRNKIPSLKTISILLVLMVCLLAWVEYLMLSGHVLPEGLHRFPPLGKLFYLSAYLTFGLNEFAAQFWTIVFTLASGWMFYHLLRLKLSTAYAEGGVAVLLALPVVFFYGNSPELDCGTLFFLIAAVYLYQKYRQNRCELFLFLTSILLSAGFLYKRYVLALLLIIAVDMVMDMMKERKLEFRRFFVLFIPVGMVAFPWLVLGKLYAIRNYQFSIDNIIGTVPEYWYLFVEEFSYPGAVLILVSVLFGAAVQRNGYARFMLLWGVGYLVFFSADFPYPVDRFSLLVMPPLVFFLTASVAAIFNEKRGKYLMGGIALVFLGMATFIKVPDVASKYRAWDFAHDLPRYDLALDYLGSLPKANLLDLGRPNGLYLLRNGLWPYLYNTTQVKSSQNIRLWWIEQPEKPLEKYLIERKIEYVVLPKEKYRHLYPEGFVVWIHTELDRLRKRGSLVLKKEFGDDRTKVQVYKTVNLFDGKRV